jgi:hypothetical protein
MAFQVFVIVSLVAFILRDVFMFFVTANKKLLDLLLLLVQGITIIIGAVHTSQVYVYRSMFTWRSGWLS